MVTEKSESIVSEMKAQAIAEILAISATSRPIDYFGFFGPFDTFLGSDFPDLLPPSMSEKLFFKSVYFCFYVLRVVNSSPNARS